MSSDTHGLFWNSNNGDRVYDADSFSEWLNHFFTSGVFANELVTTATTGMGISVSPGYVNVNGKVRFFDSASTFTLASANSTYPRIDTVVIERNETNREITMKVVTGQVSGNTPTPTAPTRSLTVYQLVIAQILVPAGATAITAANITDKRMDTSVCGYVAGTVEELDWDQITAQWTEYVTMFQNDQLDEFEAWFANVQDQLDGDTAGHLQNEIDALAGNIEDLQGDVSDLSTAISSMFVVDTVVADNKTVSSYLNFQQSAVKAGYTPIGVVGFDIANATTGGKYGSYAMCYNCHLSGTVVYFGIRNTSSSTAVIKATAYVLYQKAGS